MARPKKTAPGEGTPRTPITDITRAKSAVEELLKGFNKGEDVFACTAREDKSRRRPKPDSVISTGSLIFDALTGCGGIPLGKLVELFGPTGHGKSSLAYSLLVQAQKQFPEKVVALVDNEHSFTEEMFLSMGGNPDNIYVATGGAGETQVTFMDKMINLGVCSLVVVDSMEGLVPTAELEAEYGESVMGQRARLISSFIRKCAEAAHKTKTCVIGVNQVREKMGGRSMPGMPPVEITPGGEALKFWSHMRLRVSKGYPTVQEQRILEATLGEGHMIKVKTIKTRYAKNGLNKESYFIYGKGFNQDWELLEVAPIVGAVTKSGGYKTWISPDGETFTWQNNIQFQEKINGEVYTAFKQSVLDKLYSSDPIEQLEEEPDADEESQISTLGTEEKK